MKSVVYALVAACTTASIVLIATKRECVAILISLVAIMLIVYTLPKQTSGGDEMYSYTPGGSIKYGPKPDKQVIHNPAKQMIHNPATEPEPVRVSPEVLPPTPPIEMPKTHGSLPNCDDPPQPPSDVEMRDHIRNHGLYGIHGNLSCKKMQRSSVADKGMLQPLNARNQMIKLLSVDQLHAKDPHLIPRLKR